MKKVRKEPSSSADTALNLADQAEHGDVRAAYELALMMAPGSVTEFVEFVAPCGPITTRGFDAVVDGLRLAQFIQERKVA